MSTTTAEGPRVDVVGDVGAVDPRLRARRIAVRRHEGRRRLRRILLVGALAAVLAVGWGLTRSPLLDVDVVEVEGAQHTPGEAVVAAAGIEPGDALSGVDLDAARAAVEDLPWVASAEVHKVWPGTVQVVVREREVAAAVTAAAGGWALLDDAGRVLEIAVEPPVGRPRLTGVAPAAEGADAVGDEAQGALELAAALPPTMASRVTGVVVEGDGGLLLSLDDGVPVVEVGLPGSWDDTLAALDALLERVDLADVARVDLRVPSAPALTRRGGGA